VSPAPHADGGSAAEEATDAWVAALDALEARLLREEQSLAAGTPDLSFVALELPDAPLDPAQRVRAQLAIARVQAIAEQYRTVLRSLAPSTNRSSSPYH